jgi:hypothetical protein
MWNKPVDNPACAWAAISSAKLCEVVPGSRRSDKINTSTCRGADRAGKLSGSISIRQ